ncbi:MAG: hypothetical protein ACAH80_08495 [Alphaproteobacteria bacterium]
MSNPALEAEINSRYASDKQAFEGLDDSDRKWASAIAGKTFAVRQAIVKGGNGIVNVLETGFNVAIRIPSVFVWNQMKKGAGTAADAPVGVTAATGRAALGFTQGAIGLWSKGLGLLNRVGVMGDETCAERRRALAEQQAKLEDKRTAIADWGKRRKEQADKDRAGKKRRFTTALRKTGAALEYYGAIGLYRTFKYVLDPRLPNGKPLLVNEKANRAVGLLTAAALFCVLAYQFSKITVVAKILHIKLAHSMVTDTAPVWLKAAKQIVLQPAITIGLTAAKFITLPVIAAARGRLKATPISQGIAYEYNRMRLEADEENLKLAFEKASKAPATGPDDPKWMKFREKAKKAARKESFQFIRSFVRHVIEKSSPEFYEVRLRHYKMLKQMKEASKKAKMLPQPVPANDFSPAPGLVNAPSLKEKFDSSQNPPAPPATPPSGNAPTVPVRAGGPVP